MVMVLSEGGDAVKSQIFTIGAATVIAVVVIFAAVYIGFSLNRSASSGTDARMTGAYIPESTSAPASDPAAPQPETTAPETSAPSSGSTAIPGFDTINMRAGTLDQTAKLYNPAENTCYFLVSIILPDGKEIYRSNMIAPGEVISRIRLSSALDAGTYEGAALLYSCFSMSDLHPMNGATVKFTLEVT